MQTSEYGKLLSAIREIRKEDFEMLALAVFRYQYEHNALYRRFADLLGRFPDKVTQLSALPFLPIRFFKSQTVQTGLWQPETAFTSSGTTGQLPSRHLVRDLQWYLDNARRGFGEYYADPAEWQVLALLPAYLERKGSSLVAMADYFIRLSQNPGSGFFLHDHEHLASTLARRSGRKTLLLGVSFALLDFAEKHPMDLSDVVIMETGGMKGRREEITREALHQVMKKAFQVKEVHSEYGMTELFSQAYARGGKHFEPTRTLRAFCAEIYDPLSIAPAGKTGTLNLIDLANIDTCCFVATEDIGRVHTDGSFEVLGRLDAAELRGCNLMVE